MVCFPHRCSMPQRPALATMQDQSRARRHSTRPLYLLFLILAVLAACALVTSTGESRHRTRDGIGRHRSPMKLAMSRDLRGPLFVRRDEDVCYVRYPHLCVLRMVALMPGSASLSAMPTINAPLSKLTAPTKRLVCYHTSHCITAVCPEPSPSLSRY